MQSDRGFVQNVERAYKMRSERSRELYPLRFAARQSGSEPVERQVIQPHFVQKPQAQLNFFQNFFDDGCFRRSERKACEKRTRLLHRHLADFRDRAPGNFHRASFRAKPGSMAVRAGGVAAVAAEEYAHVQLVFFSFQESEKALHAFVFFFAVASDDGVALRSVQLAEGL